MVKGLNVVEEFSPGCEGLLADGAFMLWVFRRQAGLDGFVVHIGAYWKKLTELDASASAA